MPLRIPEKERPRLALIVRLKKDARNAILAVLKKAKPAFGHEAIIEEAISALKDELDAHTVREIFSFIVNLYWVRFDSGVSPRVIAVDVIANAKEFRDPVDGWADLHDFILQVLSLDESIGVSAKALFLAFQGQRHYHHGRVITDIRPVFARKPDISPSMFLVLHTLQIEFHENGEDREWFVCMDTRDLENLRDAATRALEKGRSLTKVLMKTEIPTSTLADSYESDDI